MSTSPSFGNCATIHVKLLVNGQPAPETHPIMAVDVWLEVNKVARARVVIADVAKDQTTFPISASSTYIPGAKLEIELGYAENTRSVFSGIIITHGLVAGPDDVAQLAIEAADPALVLTLARHTTVHNSVTDSDLMQRLIRAQDLNAEVSPTTEQHPALVQYACSDWDFLVMRADVNGLVVITEAGKVSVVPPQTDARPVSKLVYGHTIRRAQLTLDATDQLKPAALRSVAWDPSKQSLSIGAVPSVEVAELGNLSSQTLAKVFDVDDARQQTAANLTVDNLTTWSKAELMRLRLAKVRGQLECLGTTDPRPAAMVALENFGGRFDGNAFVSAVHHHVVAGSWSTEVDIGLDPVPFAVSTPRVSPPPAAGQLAAAPQLQVAVVDKLANDPMEEMRVPIRLPLASSQQAPLWARLACPHATNGAGFQFWPEQGDEVVVAFMNNDPRFPVVLGSLYSKHKAPPNPVKPANNLKAVVTKGKLRIQFDDHDHSISITTPGQHLIELNDHTRKLTIADKSGNAITFGEAGINIESNGNITLKASGTIELDASTSLQLKTDGEAKIEGMGVDLSAESSLTAHGTGEAKLTSTGEVVVQGILVRIN